jgi:hypothetical protein
MAKTELDDSTGRSIRQPNNAQRRNLDKKGRIRPLDAVINIITWAYNQGGIIDDGHVFQLTRYYGLRHLTDLGRKAKSGVRLGKNTFGINKVSILDGISQVLQGSIHINTELILSLKLSLPFII